MSRIGVQTATYGGAVRGMSVSSDPVFQEDNVSYVVKRGKAGKNGEAASGPGGPTGAGYAGGKIFATNDGSGTDTSNTAEAIGGAGGYGGGTPGQVGPVRTPTVPWISR
jgi:hypothetical protein